MGSERKGRERLQGSISRRSPPATATRLQTFVHRAAERLGASRNLTQPGPRPSMTVTASSGSPRVSPQRYDTLPLSSV
ncbi:MAG: hypothetical protein VKM92_05710, partial [Cyanobacteriota bacterium]|nr:hypothetical protein [Cyanobacteriota bacterium]